MHCDIDSDSPLTIQCQPIDTPQTVDRIDSDCGNPADTVLRVGSGALRDSVKQTTVPLTDTVSSRVKDIANLIITGAVNATVSQLRTDCQPIVNTIGNDTDNGSGNTKYGNATPQVK